MSETSYQACHRHFGRLEHETEVARNLLQRYGAPRSDTVKELRQETDMPMTECAEMLRCMWHDMELDRLKTENAKLRKLAHDVHTLHRSGLDCTECPWFEECDTTGGCPWLGIFADHIRELGVEVDK